MNPDGSMTAPVSRQERAVLDALAAAMRSSTDADQMLAIVRPSDFPPPHDTVAAAIADQRRQGIQWSDPHIVYQALWDYRQLWSERRDSGRFGRPEVDTPIEDLMDPDRWPLRFAGRVLQSGHVTDLLVHRPAVDVVAAAHRVAADRRRQVSEATMRTVHRILADPAGSSRGERQEAIGRVLRDYRRDMHAGHLYPAGKQRGSQSQGRGR